MSDQGRRYVSYLLRLWQTEREGALIWCASLESPTTGERQGFVGLADLYLFLGQETAPLDRDDPRSLKSGGTNAPETWTTQAPNVLATFGLFGNDVTVTEELLRVSVFLAGFSGFYFTIYLVTDTTFREEFFSDVEDEIRQAFAVRAAYLGSLAVTGESGRSS